MSDHTFTALKRRWSKSNRGSAILKKIHAMIQNKTSWQSQLSFQPKNNYIHTKKTKTSSQILVEPWPEELGNWWYS